MLDNELTVALDLTQVKTVDDLEGAATVPPGRYHVLIREVRRESDPSPHLLIKYETLAGTNAVGVGLVAAEKFFLSDKAAKRVAILANRLGLMAPSQLGQRVNFDAGALVGKDLVVEVIAEEFTAKDGGKRSAGKWSFAGFYSPNDERAKGVPRGRFNHVPAPPRQQQPARQASLPGTATADAYADL